MLKPAGPLIVARFALTEGTAPTPPAIPHELMTETDAHHPTSTTAVVEFGGAAFSIDTLADGCSVSRHLRTSGRFYEEDLLMLLAAIVPPNTTVIDVGAHIGNHSLFFAEVAGHEVLAVEPNPEVLPILRSNLSKTATSTSVAPVAASDEAGRVSMSHLVAADVGTNAITDGGASLAVDSLPLDEIVAEFAPAEFAERPVGLIKIDVEGHEASVLRGARALIHRHHPIVTTEVQDLAKLDEIEQFFDDVGYRPMGTFNPTPTIVWTHPGGAGDDPASVARLRTAASRRTVDVTNRLNNARREIAELAKKPEKPPFVLYLSDEVSDEIMPDGSQVEVVTLRSPGTDRPRSRSAVLVDVATVFERHDGAPCILLADFSSSTSQVLDAIVRGLGVDYTLIFPEECVLPANAFELVNGAARRVIVADVEPPWASGSIFAFDLVDEVVVEDVRPRSTQPTVPAPNAQDGGDAGLRVAVVAYYGPPCRTVSVNRVVYWRDHLASVAASAGRPLTVDLVTATGDDRNRDAVIRVRDDGGWSSSEPGLRRRASVLDSLGLDTISVHWARTLGPVLEDYDVVVLSGNPFHFFEVGSLLRESGTKVILDFRDPFATNPRFRLSDEQSEYLAVLERRYLAFADHVISVNETCLDLLDLDARVPRTVIANGFDEALFDGRRPQREHRGVRIALAGRLYATHDPTHLLASGLSHGLDIVHAGPTDHRLEGIDARGWVDLGQLAELLRGVDLGVIFTNGDDFESTTKVFDYIGANLEILVITTGEPEAGELGRLLDPLDGVHWVRNDPDEVEHFFARYEPTQMDRGMRLDFSRRANAARLVDIIEQVAAR